MNAASLRFGCFLLSLAVTGCHRAPIGQVQGKVTYNGYNLRSGLVVMVPDTTKNQVGQLATGKIREDGTFQMYTGNTLGVASGFYRVSIRSLAPTNYDQRSGGKYDIPQSLILEKFADPETSKIALEVKPSLNDFHLDLLAE